MLVSTITSATDQLLSSRERYQFICRHRTSGSSPSAPPKPSHDCLAAIRALDRAAARCLLQNHDPLSNHKLDLGVRLNSERVPDVDRGRASKTSAIRMVSLATQQAQVLFTTLVPAIRLRVARSILPISYFGSINVG